MIVTHSCQQPTILLPNGALSGVQLIPENAYKGYSMYEARISAGQTVPLQSPNDQACVHYYYFITGKGKCERKDGREDYEVGPDQVVALSSDMMHTLKVSTEGALRVLVTYYPDAKCTYKSLELVRSLSEVIGTERDISFGNGESRRFITKQDGFPLTITNTLVFSSTSSRQVYRNNIEAAYYFAGKMTYHFQDGDGQWTCEQTRIDENNGTNFFLNVHDKHIVANHEGDSICVCIFDPPLSGEERHHYIEGGFSSY